MGSCVRVFRNFQRDVQVNQIRGFGCYSGVYVPGMNIHQFVPDTFAECSCGRIFPGMNHQFVPDTYAVKCSCVRFPGMNDQFVPEFVPGTFAVRCSCPEMNDQFVPGTSAVKHLTLFPDTMSDAVGCNPIAGRFDSSGMSKSTRYADQVATQGFTCIQAGRKVSEGSKCSSPVAIRDTNLLKTKKK